MSGETSEITARSKEETATCLRGIAIDFTWADEFTRSKELLQRALAIAPRESSIYHRILEDLGGVQGSSEKEKLWKDLQPIKNAPALQTINGCGLTLYGCTDADPETKSYLATYYFVFFFIPIFPICRYRVISTGDRSYRFLGKTPLRIGDKWHLGISLSLIVIVFLWTSAGPSKNSYNYSTTYSSNPSTENITTELSADTTEPSTNTAQAFAEYDDYDKNLNAGNCGVSGLCAFNVYDSSGNVIASNISSQGAPEYLTAIHGGHRDFYTFSRTYNNDVDSNGSIQLQKTKYFFDTSIGLYKEANARSGKESAIESNNTLKIQNEPAKADSSQLLKERIEAGRAKLTTLEASYNQLADEVQNMKLDLNQQQAELDTLETQTKAGMDVVEEYESKRQAYNQLVEKHNQILSKAKKAKQEYNALLDEDHRMVQEYNSR